MSVREEPWDEGTPCWAELAVPDLERGRRFYGELLGWEFAIGSAETGYYSEGLVGGRRVAALNGYRPDPTAPVSWLTFLAAADTTATAARATTAGAVALAGPVDVMGFGRMAVLADPVGVPFAVWQAGTSLGAEVVNEPGTMIWNEHMSGDWTRARDFYTGTFGLTLEDMSAPGFDYATLQRGDRAVGGIGAWDDAPGWQVYFGVTDTDATTAAAERLGGAVALAPQDSTYGRLAWVVGPFGERFWLMSTDEASTPAAP
ncbi:VOC family protein [Cellulomonas sp. NPDC058312]|uniref:VOC family protein n=1 Tax=Cellulomonas sp. NPDC058312 TaxID=3346441 RepID=UPI0036EC3FB7